MLKSNIIRQSTIEYANSKQDGLHETKKNIKVMHPRSLEQKATYTSLSFVITRKIHNYMKAKNN